MPRVIDTTTIAALAELLERFQDLAFGVIGSESAEVTSVNASTESVHLVEADLNRKGLALLNNSTGYAYVTFSDESSVSLFTLRMAPGSFWTMDPPIYKGVVSCIWTNTNGNMMVTKL